MVRARMMVTCPCCKGEKRLMVEDPDAGFAVPMFCCHCAGEGEVEVEVEETE